MLAANDTTATKTTWRDKSHRMKYFEGFYFKTYYIMIRTSCNNYTQRNGRPRCAEKNIYIDLEDCEYCKEFRLRVIKK